MLDLNGQYFDRIHVCVEELDNATEFRRNLVSDKDHPDLGGLQIGLDLIPKYLHDRLVIGTGSDKLQNQLSRIIAAFLACGFESGTDGLDRPVDHGVGGVVKHLTHDLTADASVAGALDLDQSGDGVLVEEEVIK